MKSPSHGPEPCASANSAISAKMVEGGGFDHCIMLAAPDSFGHLGNPSSGDGTRTRSLQNQLLCQFELHRHYI